MIKRAIKKTRCLKNTNLLPLQRRMTRRCPRCRHSPRRFKRRSRMIMMHLSYMVARQELPKYLKITILQLTKQPPQLQHQSLTLQFLSIIMTIKKSLKMNQVSPLSLIKLQQRSYLTHNKRINIPYSTRKSDIFLFHTID